MIELILGPHEKFYLNNMRNALIALLLLIHLIASAQNDSVPQSLKIKGYAEIYYSYDINQPAGKTIPYYTNYNRHNDFSVNEAIILAQYNKEKIRASFGFQAGTYVLSNYAAEQRSLQNIYDCNIGYRLTEKLWLDAGIFGNSHIGTESVIALDNWTLTRSLSAENTPYYETGARLQYKLSEHLTFSALVLNGWQNITDRNRNKALGTQITYNRKNLILNSSSFFGEGRNLSYKVSRQRFFHDFYVIVNLTDRLAITGLFDCGLEQTKHNSSKWNLWWNPMFLLRQKMGQKWAVCIREEYFHDPHKVIIQTLSSKTAKITGTSFNIDYIPAGGLLIRVETKYLNGSRNLFIGNNKLFKDDLIFTTSMAVVF